MRVYSIEHPNIAITSAVQSLIDFTAAATFTNTILRAWCGQKTNTTSAQQDIQIRRNSTTGTNVTAPTANPLETGMPAFGGTVRGLCTTEGTPGTVMYPDSFNWVNGWIFLATQFDQIMVPGGGICCLRTPTAPAALTCGIGLMVGELG